MGFKTNLNPKADYQIEVFPGVFWIPANTLGGSRYSWEEVCALLPLTPEEKAVKIETLYEAIQLYQAGKFHGFIDNVKIVDQEAGIIWDMSKPGYHAVRTNGGCCAANTNWLNYLLKGKYQEIGTFNFAVADDNGHLINYIRHENAYYFVDMMMQRADSLAYTGFESGDIGDFRWEYFTGYLYKTASFEDFVAFFTAKHPHTHVYYAVINGEVCAEGLKCHWIEADESYALCFDRPAQFCLASPNTKILYADSEQRCDTNL